MRLLVKRYDSWLRASASGAPYSVTGTVTALRDQKNLPVSVHHRSWPDVYAWLTRQSKKSDWARRCAEYLEVAEERATSAEYLKEGMLTTFTGIPFEKENPYTYVTAKRTLSLLREELCKDRRLRALGADLHVVSISDHGCEGHSHRSVPNQTERHQVTAPPQSSRREFQELQVSFA